MGDGDGADVVGAAGVGALEGDGLPLGEVLVGADVLGGCVLGVQAVSGRAQAAAISI